MHAACASKRVHTHHIWKSTACDHNVVLHSPLFVNTSTLCCCTKLKDTEISFVGHKNNAMVMFVFHFIFGFNSALFLRLCDSIATKKQSLPCISPGLVMGSEDSAKFIPRRCRDDYSAKWLWQSVGCGMPWLRRGRVVVVGVGVGVSWVWFGFGLVWLPW